MKKTQLFLLHFAGGNCYSFQFLTPLLHDFEVITLELPGRGKRIREPLLKDFEEAALDLYTRILEQLHSPAYILYGHSMGAYLALRIARMLEEDGRPPSYVVVSGNAGPGLLPPEKDKLRYALGRKEFMEELTRLGGVPEELLENEELFGFFEPILRADFQIAEENHMEQLPAIDVPIHAMMGNEEKDAGQIDNWGRCTRSRFTCELLEGDHFFIFRHAGKIAAMLRNCITTAMPARTPESPEKTSGLFADLSGFSEKVNHIFNEVIAYYHFYDTIYKPMKNPYMQESLEWMLYSKCWTDTLQWHVEDEIRSPVIEPENALQYKRRIDRLNQERTEMVEKIDDLFLTRFGNVARLPGARFNSESPAWALDRLSILSLKIYHMQAEASRTDATAEHIRKCRNRLGVLMDQQKDLFLSINELLQDISKGHKYMKVYKQMKMYNDPATNPVLYNAVKSAQ